MAYRRIVGASRGFAGSVRPPGDLPRNGQGQPGLEKFRPGLAQGLYLESLPRERPVSKWDARAHFFIGLTKASEKGKED